MSRNHPLTYPAPVPSRRIFEPRKQISIVEKKPSVFDTVFKHPLVRTLMKVPGHGTFPVVIGAGVAVTGHSAMLVRSTAIIVCAVWSSMDVGIWISESNDDWVRQWKIILFCATSWLACSLAMGVMYYFLLSTLEDQRADVYQHLEISHATPSGHSNDPMFEIFSITNRGSFDISKKHGITCFVNMAIGNNGTSRDSGMWLTSHGTKVSMGGYLSPDRTPASSLLKAGGDVESEACLRFFGNSFVLGSDCIDTTLSFWYSLETQDALDQEKRFRFVAFKGPDGKFSWAAESIDSKEDYCGSYFKPLS